MPFFAPLPGRVPGTAPYKDASKIYNHLRSRDTEFKIDFGDSTGWHTFDDITTQFYTAIYVYNTMGQLVKKWKPWFANQQQHCYFNVPEQDWALASGLYQVVLQAGAEKHWANLIIK
jgi:hypothetical protein